MCAASARQQRACTAWLPDAPVGPWVRSHITTRWSSLPSCGRGGHPISHKRVFPAQSACRQTASCSCSRLPAERAGRAAWGAHPASTHIPLAMMLIAAGALVMPLPSLADLPTADPDTFENIPLQLQSEGQQQPSLGSLFQGSNKKSVETCTRNCMPACIRGGEGAPGLGPVTIRKDLTTFKDSFRSRQYCLTTCAQACADKLKTKS